MRRIGHAIGAEEIRIPVKEEKVRVSKDVVVKEEVNVKKRKVHGTESVTEDVRHEELREENNGKTRIRHEKGLTIPRTAANVTERCPARSLSGAAFALLAMFGISLAQISFYAVSLPDCFAQRSHGVDINGKPMVWHVEGMAGYRLASATPGVPTAGPSSFLHRLDLFRRGLPDRVAIMFLAGAEGEETLSSGLPKLPRMRLREQGNRQIAEPFFACGRPDAGELPS